MGTMQALKDEIRRRGRTFKEFLDEMRMEYNRGIRIINGFTHPPADFSAQAREVFRRWDGAQTEHF